MSSWLRYALVPVALAGLVGLGGLSVFEDALPVGGLLALALSILDTRVLLAVAVGIFAASFLLYLISVRREDPGRVLESGRPVEAVVPVYEDAAVVHRSVEGLLDSEYADLTVTIVPEPDDAPTLKRARELAAAYDGVRCVENARPGSKAGAINTVLERTEAGVIGLFDADQQPHPKLVGHAMAALGDADAARVRSLPRPAGGIVESEAYYEYLLLFFLPQKLASALLGLQVVGTRSVLVERSVFERVGLLDEATLTEDMAFTHDCHQAGVSIRELDYYPAFEEPAHTLTDWWWQRVRWMSGHLEVGARQLREWRAVTDTDALGSLLTLVGTFVAGVLLATTLPKLTVSALAYPLAVGAGLVGIYAVALATRAVDNRTAETSGFEGSWLLVPLFFTLYGLVIVQVMVRALLGREDEWYQAEKGVD